MSHCQCERNADVGGLQEVLKDATLVELGALATGVLSVILFGLLGRAVLRNEVMEFNREVMLAIHRYSTPTLNALSMAITQLGSVPAVAIVGGVIGWILWRNDRRIDAWVLASVLIGGGILSFTLKQMFGMQRPDVFEPLYHPSGLSFPSGHSLISYSLWGFVAAWLVATDLRNPLRWFAAALCIALATAVAISRLYIGVHWPSDIAAGLLVAAAWLATCFIGRQFARSRLAEREDIEPTG